jgi:hypothetical protein
LKKTSEKTAKLIKQQTVYSGGMEDTLDSVGGIFLFLGILGGIGAVVGAIAAFNDNETGTGVNLLCVGFVSMLAGAINRIFLKAGAEIIRLLKKTSGLKFSGEITQPIASNYCKCSICGTLAESHDEKCYACGAKFEK